MCVKVCCTLGKNFTDTFQLLNQAYGEDCVSRTQCYEWFKRFKEGCKMSNKVFLAKGRGFFFNTPCMFPMFACAQRPRSSDKT